MKTCPEGFYCLDNNFFYFFCIMIFLLIIYAIIQNNNNNTIIKNKYHEENITPTTTIVNKIPPTIIESSQPTTIINREQPLLIDPRLSERNRIYDPLSPPERMYPYTGGIPINIETRGYGPGYHQVGILEKVSIDPESTIYDKRPQILPLFGKPTYPGSSKWFYYTTSDNNGFKIPFTINGKTCNNDYGCNELYDGDSVDLAGYNAKYKVSIYSIDSPKYIPYVLA